MESLPTEPNLVSVQIKEKCESEMTLAVPFSAYRAQLLAPVGDRIVFSTPPIFFFDCQRGGEDPHLIVLPNCPKWLNSRKFYSWRTLAKSVTHSTPTPNTFFSLSSHYAASRTRPPLPSGLLGVVYVSIALHLLGRPSASLESSLFLPETPHCCGVSTAPNSTAR